VVQVEPAVPQWTVSSDAEARSVFAADVPGLLTVLRAALPETHRARRAAGS
jgi:hypothetical protein